MVVEKLLKSMACKFHRAEFSWISLRFVLEQKKYLTVIFSMAFQFFFFNFFFLLVNCLQPLTVFLKGLITRWSSLCVFRPQNRWMCCLVWIELGGHMAFPFSSFLPGLFYLSGSRCECSHLPIQ